MKLLVSLVSFIAILGIGVTTYFGIFPGLSDVLGTNKPRDLGMEFSQESWDSAYKKGGGEYKQLPKESKVSLSYEGKHDVKENFTAEELTSLGANKNWRDYPVSDLQVRINEDDTMEVSGVLKLTKMDSFLNSIGIGTEEYKKALEKVGIPLKDVPFYAKGFGTATNNNLDVTVSNFEIGRFPIPSNILNDYQDEAMDFGYKLMNNMNGFSLNEAKIENGSLHFDGTLPDVEYTIPAY